MNQTGSNPNLSNGYLAVPRSGRGPGVLVLHAWWGLTPFFKQVCDRLAEAGFVAFAPDYYSGKTAALPAEAQKLADALSQDQTTAQLAAAADALQADPRVEGAGLGVVGFSLGGMWALLLATLIKPERFYGVVTYYGLEPGLEVADFAQAQSAFLGHFAALDEFEPLDNVYKIAERIRNAGQVVGFHIYPDAEHWFAESDRPNAYRPEDAELAWARTLEFLHRRVRWNAEKA